MGAVGFQAMRDFLKNQAGVISVDDDSQKAGYLRLSVHLAYWNLLPHKVPVLPGAPVSILVRTDTYPMKSLFLEIVGAVSEKGALPGWALTSKDDFLAYVFLNSKRVVLAHRESLMDWFQTQPEATQLEAWKSAQETPLEHRAKISSRGALISVSKLLEKANADWVVSLDISKYIPESADLFVKERNDKN